MQTEFRALAELCEKLGATTKRTLMVDLVAEFLKQLDADEVEPAASMILGQPFPKWDQRTLNASWATLSEIIGRLTKADWSEFAQAFSKTGDVGEAARTLFGASKVRRQATLLERSVTILEVRRNFTAIAETSGYGSKERKERLIETLLGNVTPVETKYLLKIIIGEMRTGFHEGLMEMAVSKAFGIPHELVQRATMMTGDVGEVAAIAKEGGREGVSNLQFHVFRPIKPMLAQTVNDVSDAISEHGGKTAFEQKLDGARIQIHKSANIVKIYSRRLTDVTESLPDIVERVQEKVEAREVILEGEVIALGEDGSPLPFQHLMRRFRRVHEIGSMAKRIKVKLYLFDIIYLNGQSLIGTSYSERRRKLDEISGGIPLTKQVVTDDPQVAEQFLKQAMNEGHEGLMAKRLDSPYNAGVRGKLWLKIKKTLEPLDLVIVAAEYGYGRRHGWLSDYYLAARDSQTGEYLVIGKTFKGLTDEEIIQMTRRIKELAITENHHSVKVIPRIVVEVEYNEVQRSPKYKSGMALRFARITRIREDKDPEEADTIQKVKEIYEKQFEKKARY